MVAVLLIFTLIFSMGSMTFAHELYFVDLKEGTMGEPYNIKLIWGHFPGTPDPESSYFNHVGNGRLYVLTPEGQEIDIEMEKQTDHYSASFIPETGGDFQIIFKHDRGIIDWKHGEPQGFQHINTLAKAYIPVDGEPDIHAYDKPANLDLEIIALTDIGHFHLGDEFKAVIKYLGEPLANQSVTIVSPTAEYEEVFANVTTDENGVFSFVPNDENTWMLKVGLFDDQRGGIQDDQEYIGTRYTLTTFFFIHDHEEDEEVTEGTSNDVVNEVSQIAEKADTTSTLLVVATLVLLAGAVFFFIKGRKKSDVNG